MENNASSEQSLIEADNLGVCYNLKFKRDDLRSIVLGSLKKQDVQEKYNWALSSVDFKGFSGEILGIIGSNGAGKTTLCRVIAGLLRPDSGFINVEGEVSALLSLGAGFNKELSGRENIFLNGMMIGMSRKEVSRYYDEILEFSGLSEFIDEPVKHYSKGMKARLGFSIAAMLKPEVLVLDETLSTGDINFRQRSAKKIKELTSHAKLVIIVTHNMDFIVDNCSRAIWIDHGGVRMEGEPQAVSNAYIDAVPRALRRAKKRKTRLKIGRPEIIESDDVVAKVENLGIRFEVKKKEYWALDDVSFELKKGEVLGIIGSNGAGKTTLCRSISKIYAPDRGTVKVNGDISALLSLGSGFNKQLSVSDNILLNGLMLGIPKKEILSLQEEILSFADLDEHREKPVKTFSSGMKARLGFSIAAAIQPELLIIDESLSPGDASFKKKARLAIKEMISNAEAVMIVTHSLKFVRKTCTRVIWLDQGKIRFDGSPKKAVKKYRKELLNDEEN